MKKKAFLALLVFISFAAQAQLAPVTSPPGSQAGTVAATNTPYTVVERGPNHQVWEATNSTSLTNGQVAASINRFVELASGLNYLDTNGQWTASQETIDATATGGAAVHGQHQAYFPYDIYEERLF